MPWTDYRREWMQAGEAQEERNSYAWALLLLLLLRRESEAKRAVRLALRGVGTTSDGRWSFHSRRVLRKVRSDVLVATNGLRAGTLAEFAARSSLELKRARVLWERGYRGASTRLLADLKKTPPRDITEPKLRWPGRRAKALEKAGEGWDANEREAVRLDAEWNPKRWIRNDSDKLYEEVVRLVAPDQPEDNVYQMLLGSNSPVDKRKTAVLHDNGWAFNRNNLFLSSVNHWRAVHRANTYAAARRLGITSFMLLPPKSRANKVAPGGILGQHLYRVWDLPDLEEALAVVNRTRRTSSSLNTLGFGYGDVSYVVPIPSIFYPAAVAEASSMRSRWIRRAS